MSLRKETRPLLLRLFTVPCLCRAMIRVSLLLGLPVQISSAQTTFHQLYPLAIGNRWEYTEDALNFRVLNTVIDDTTINSSQFHRISTDHEQWGVSFELLRVTNAGEVLKWENNRECLLYKLAAGVGEAWYTGDSVWIVSVDEDGMAQVFGALRYYKIFTFHLLPDSLVEITRLFSFGIGLVSYNGHIDAPSGNLVGAVIGDTTYGTLSTVARYKWEGIPSPVLNSYPNPFNSEVVLTLSGVTSDVLVTIYDVLGKQIISFPAAGNGLKWDSRTDDGSLAPSGVYFAVVKAEDFILTHKMLLLR